MTDAEFWADPDEPITLDDIWATPDPDEPKMTLSELWADPDEESD